MIRPAETIDLIEALGLQHNLYRASALQYLIRAGQKTDDPRADLRKAISYLGRELERLDRANLPDYTGEDIKVGGTD